MSPCRLKIWLMFFAMRVQDSPQLIKEQLLEKNRANECFNATFLRCHES